MKGVVTEVVICEGGISAGKSSFLTAMKRVNPSVGIVPERVPIKHLTKFYKDSEYSLGFQLIMASERIIAQTEALKLEKEKGTDIVFLERSIYADDIFARNCLTDSEDYTMYQSYCKGFLWPAAVKPAKCIYLQSDPVKCQARIYERMYKFDPSRTCEDCIKLEYLQRLHQGHEDWLLGSDPGFPVVVVNTEHYDWRIPEVAEKVYKIVTGG